MLTIFGTWIASVELAMLYELHTEALSSEKRDFRSLAEACDAADDCGERRAWVVAAWLPRTSPERVVYQNEAERAAVERLLKQSRNPLGRNDRLTTPAPPEYAELAQQTKEPRT